MNTTNHNSAFARQPIFDRNLNTYAYELLYRGEIMDMSNTSIHSEVGDLATNQVINNAFIDIGIEKVVGNHLAFINMTRSLLIKGDPLPFAHDQVVLEILEDIAADTEVIHAVEKLVSQGYKVALDDFIFDESLWPLINLAEIIKIDILLLSSEELKQHVDLLKQENVKLLAEKVETQQQFEQCKALGFDYFQGFFFSKPLLIKNTPLPSSHLNILNLIGKLQDPATDFDEVEELISHDVSLSYKLLKLLNSAAFALPEKIDSIKRGLVILGFDTIKSWTTLIALHSINPITPELMTLTLVRAKMCENLASDFNASPETAFTVGLFSTIEAMLLHPTDELLKVLPLNEAVKKALLDQQGELGEMLKIVMLCERGLWDNIEPPPISIADFGEAYLNATQWAIDIQKTL
ncbi:MAG: EAL and HDOD domain-containing protein [Methylophagaceae bacterium]